jgi:hypothetical protein
LDQLIYGSHRYPLLVMILIELHEYDLFRL